MAGPKVAICIYNGLSMFEFGTAYEIFVSYARGRPGWYQTKIVSVDTPVVTLGNGLCIHATDSLAALADFGSPTNATTTTDNSTSSRHIPDTIIVPGWSGLDITPAPALLAALQHAHAAGCRILSFCSGAFVLAAAGLLSGKKATTHWKYAEQFSQRFPDVDLQVNQLYVGSDNVFTSAGSAACIDLSLALIQQDFGAITATSVAKRLVVPGNRPGGQQQFIELPVPKRVSELSKVMDWALQNVDQKLTTATLSARVHLSRRTFDRHFSRIYGMSLRSWLLNARLEKAKFLLESTELTVDFIALESGFATALSLRNHFDKYVGVSPGRYRKTLSKAKGGL